MSINVSLCGNHLTVGDMSYTRRHIKQNPPSPQVLPWVLYYRNSEHWQASKWLKQEPLPELIGRRRSRGFNLSCVFWGGVGFKLIKKRFGWFLASGDQEACTIIKQLHSSVFRAGYTIPFIECIVHPWLGFSGCNTVNSVKEGGGYPTMHWISNCGIQLH